MSSPLLVDGGYNAAATTIVAKFAEVDALPCTEIKVSVSDGDGEAHAEEGTFGVGGHIVVSLHGVVIVGLAFPYEMVHNLTEVGAHVGVGIFVDGQCA